MALRLYFHPLSSFCQKVLIALYENDTPFEPHIVNLMDDASRAAFQKIWPIGKFPARQRLRTRALRTAASRRGLAPTISNASACSTPAIVALNR